MKWSNQVEEELILLVKDWLKAQQRTQAELRKVLNADSTRMPSIIEALKKEYIKGTEFYLQILSTQNLQKGLYDQARSKLALINDGK